MTDIALGQHFHVEIDGQTSLGDWTKCEGLTVEYDIYEYKEGGVNEYIHRLPGRAKYQNIKLTRPVTKDTAKVGVWLSNLTPDLPRTTMKISVTDEAGTEIAAWSLDAVIPIRWTGPTLDVAQSSVATESLELAHNGFLRGGL
jgi:phage tail-like protein